MAARPILPGDGDRSGQGTTIKGTPEGETAQTPKLSAADDDGVLMSRVAIGDETAFRLLIDRHLAAVVGLARRILGDTAEAEDVAQEAMLRLWRTGDRLQVGSGGVRGWLLRVARNLCIDRQRAGRRLRVVEEVPEVIDPPKQLDGLEAADVSATVDQAMLELPERQRIALLLFHHEGLSLVEIGQQMDVSPEAVESLLARGRRGLRAKLSGVWRQLLDLDADRAE